MIDTLLSTPFQRAYKFLIQSGKIESQQDIIDKTGVNKGALSQYVNAKQEVSKPFKTKFQNTFGLKLADFESDTLTGKPEILTNKEVRTNDDSLNKLIDSNQILAEANKDLAASHKLLAEMLYKATVNDFSERSSNLEDMMGNVQSVLLLMATGRRWKSEDDLRAELNNRDEKTGQAQKKGIEFYTGSSHIDVKNKG